jgi:hypothetical protein
LPGFGFCASTLPFLRLDEAFCLTLPTVQCARLILAFAFVSVRPTSFGTTHFALNVAVAVLSVVIDSEHAPLPAHAPLQPLKIEFGVGFAVSVTAVPYRNPTLQVAPQPMPAGELVTVPRPLPFFMTVSLFC